MFILNLALRFFLSSLALSLNLLIYFIIQVQMVVGLALLHESCAPNPIKCLIPKMSTTQVVAHFNSLLVSNAYALMDTFKKNHQYVLNRSSSSSSFYFLFDCWEQKCLNRSVSMRNINRTIKILGVILASVEMKEKKCNKEYFMKK